MWPADSPYKAASERMNTKHYPNSVILILSPSPTHKLETKGVETKLLAMPEAFIILWNNCGWPSVPIPVASVEVTVFTQDSSWFFTHHRAVFSIVMQLINITCYNS